MKAIIIRNPFWHHPASVLSGFDLVIKIVPLFEAVVYPATEDAQKILDHLGWRKATFAPVVSFSFSLVTEPEIITKLRATFADLEIFTIQQQKPPP